MKNKLIKKWEGIPAFISFHLTRMNILPFLCLHSRRRQWIAKQSSEIVFMSFCIPFWKRPKKYIITFLCDGIIFFILWQIAKWKFPFTTHPLFSKDFFICCEGNDHNPRRQYFGSVEEGGGGGVGVWNPNFADVIFDWTFVDSQTKNWSYVLCIPRVV